MNIRHVCLQALRIVRHTLNGLVSAHSRYAQSLLLYPPQLVLCSFNANFHGRRFSRRSIVHRDVKPDNIMLHLPVEDLNDLHRISAKLLDFGVAVVTETGGNMRDTMVTGTTGLAAQIGTPHFMSPEAFGEETVDARTDIWSVGVTLFLMLTGKLPFEGEGKKRNPHQIGAAVERDMPDFGLLTAAGLPQEVTTMVMKAMEKSRDDRYATAAEMLKQVESVEALILLDSLNEAVEDNDLDKFRQCLHRLNSTKTHHADPDNTESYPQAVSNLPPQSKAIAGAMHRICSLGSQEPQSKGGKEPVKNHRLTMLEEILKRIPLGDSCLDVTVNGITALMLAAADSQPQMVEMLLDHRCATNAIDHETGKTAWGLAQLFDRTEVAAVFDKYAETHEHAQLRQEQAEEALRKQVSGSQPAEQKVPISFEINFSRLSLWQLRRDTQTYGASSKKIGGGVQGAVYLFWRIAQRIGVIMDGKMLYLDTAVLKIVQSEANQDELIAEINTLSKLEHEAVVRIVGYSLGALPNAKPSCLLLLEVCDVDLEQLNLNRSVELTWEMRHQMMLKVADGMAYMHSEGCHHFDFKAGNVLCKYEKDAQGEIIGYRVRIADFGMESIGKDSKDKLSASAADEPEPEPDTTDARQSGTGSATGRPIGTCEQMSPEAFVGRPEAASDVFSYAAVLFELMTRARIYYAFDGVEGSVFFNKQTGREEKPNIWLVPQRVARGERAEFPTDLYCPKQWKLVMETGWCQQPEDRPTFSDICSILGTVDVSVLAKEEEQFKAENALQTAEREAKAAAAEAAKADAYSNWLAEHGFEQQRDELFEYDIREPKPGSNEALPLEKLQEMLAEEEDDADSEDFKDMLEDLFGEDDKEAQTKFRQAVAALRTSIPQRPKTVSGQQVPSEATVAEMAGALKELSGAERAAWEAMLTFVAENDVVALDELSAGGIFRQKLEQMKAAQQRRENLQLPHTDTDVECEAAERGPADE